MTNLSPQCLLPGDGIGGEWCFWPSSCSFAGMFEREWDRVTVPRLGLFGAGLGLFFVVLFSCEPGFVPVLDHANLLFHEAGHPIVGIFSSHLEPYGGTLGQLVFPCVVAVTCWRSGKTFGFVAAIVWFCENCFNIARYMADARRLELPLVGGGDHDWNTIFSRWGVLPYDIQYAAFVKLAGWIGISLACAWLLWRATRPQQIAD